jgi:hypothetical protein
VVPHSKAENNQIVPGTWTFERKWYPDVQFRKHKSQFSVRGDIKKLGGQRKVSMTEGEPIEHLDGKKALSIYTPVVSWITAQLMLILALILGLKTKQIDFSNAFAQA